MRLIDADVLLDFYFLNRVIPQKLQLTTRQQLTLCRWCVGEWVLQGENEHDYETSLEEKCSLCGRYVYRYDTHRKTTTAPNCGAKMEDKPCG